MARAAYRNGTPTPAPVVITARGDQEDLRALGTLRQAIRPGVTRRTEEHGNTGPSSHVVLRGGAGARSAAQVVELVLQRLAAPMVQSVDGRLGPAHPAADLGR